MPLGSKPEIKQKEGVKHDTGKIPLGVVLTKQFPLALREVAKCSQYGHDRYELNGDWDNFKKVENWQERYPNALFRHYFEKEGIDESGLKHLVHAAWNILAELELTLRNE